jgi:20S proteasome alpha/beta subunit
MEESSMTELRVAVPKEVDKYLEATVRTGMFTNKAEFVRSALLQYVNTMAPVSQGFDTELMFSPDGRIYQLEYAREASIRGKPIVGMVCKDGAILAATKAKAPNYDEKLGGFGEKVHKISNKIAIAGCGMVPDMYIFVDTMRKEQKKNAEDVLSQIRDIYREYALRKDIRPLGVNLLVAINIDKPRLFEFDVSGAFAEYYATILGDGYISSRIREGEALNILKAGYNEKIDVKKASKLALEVLGNPKEYDIMQV